MSEFDFNHGHKKRQELASNIANSYQQQSSAATPELQKGEEQLSAEFDFNHAHNHRSLMKSQIHNSFIQEESTTGSISKSEESDLEKAEGSRGGKIIGHTKSGKPIYESKSSKGYHGSYHGISHKRAYEHFTSDEHEEAENHYEAKKEEAAKEYRDKVAAKTGLKFSGGGSKTKDKVVGHGIGGLGNSFSDEDMEALKEHYKLDKNDRLSNVDVHLNIKKEIGQDVHDELEDKFNANATAAAHHADDKRKKSGKKVFEKSEEDELEKGGKRAVIGEKRTFGGREYVKTSSGWKFHGKGTGAKAQEHVKNSSTESSKKSSEEKVESASLSDEEFKKRKQHLLDRMDRMKTGGPGFKKLNEQLKQLNDSHKKATSAKRAHEVDRKIDPVERAFFNNFAAASKDIRQEVAEKYFGDKNKDLSKVEPHHYDQLSDMLHDAIKRSERSEKFKRGEAQRLHALIDTDPHKAYEEAKKYSELYGEELKKNSKAERFGESLASIKAEYDAVMKEAKEAAKPNSSKKESAKEGEIRTFGGREYIKKDGKWKYHPKGASKSTEESASKNVSLQDLKESKNGTVYYKGEKTRSVYPSYGYWHVTFPEGSKMKDFQIKGGDNVELKHFKIVEEKKEASKSTEEKKESSTAFGKHIGDMSATEKKALATKLGISTEGKTIKQVDKAITDAMVDKQLADFKASKKGSKVKSVVVPEKFLNSSEKRNHEGTKTLQKVVNNPEVIKVIEKISKVIPQDAKSSMWINFGENGKILITSHSDDYIKGSSTYRAPEKVERLIDKIAEKYNATTKEFQIIGYSHGANPETRGQGFDIGFTYQTFKNEFLGK